MMENLTRGEALLDLLPANAEELIREVKFGGSLDCSNHALVEFSILRVTGWVKCTVRTLNHRKANFQFFRVLVHGIPWETALRTKEVNDSLETFKDIFLRVQEL